MSRRNKVRRVQSQPRQQPAPTAKYPAPWEPWEQEGQATASCPYNLDNFEIYRTAGSGGPRNVADAYIIISPATSKNTNGQMRLSMSRDVGDRILAKFNSLRYEFLFNKSARIFAIRPKSEGAKFSISSNGKKTRHSMSIQTAINDVRSVYGDNVRRIMLKPEYYDECVIFRPTGEIVYSEGDAS